MRRRRLVDVRVGDHVEVWAMLRDSHVDDAGIERCVHEYEVRATVARDTMVVEDIEATPHALPWIECPLAAASAPALRGERLSQVASRVRTEFTGTSTCTHLNTVLTSLGDVEQMLAQLREAP
jgi:hypothetical protein